VTFNTHFHSKNDAYISLHISMHLNFKLLLILTCVGSINLIINLKIKYIKNM
jgi:hypothetical protein